MSQSIADQTLAAGAREVLAMTGVATVSTGPTEIDVECQSRAEPTDSAYGATANLIAQQVGTVH